MSPNPTIRRRTQHHEPFAIWNDEVHAPDPAPDPGPASNPRLQIQEYMEQLARRRSLPRSPPITLTMIEQLSREGAGEREMGLELETLIEEEGEDEEEEKEREDAEEERGEKREGGKMDEDRKGGGEPGVETGVDMGVGAQLGVKTPVEMGTQAQKGKRSGIKRWAGRKRLRNLLSRLRERFKVMAIKVKNVLSI